MTDEPALLATILAHPDDDRPRLVYADWLEEHGQRDRARLIRVQVELAQRPDSADDPCGLRAEEERLEAACENALPRLDGITWGGFERGLVRSVYPATPAAFRRHAGVISDMGSAHRVSFETLDGFDVLAQVPALARFTELVVFQDPHWGLRDGDPEHRFNDDLRAQLRAARAEVLRCARNDGPAGRPSQNLAKRLARYGESYFEFVTTPGVEPTNNLAEQAIRFVVIDRLVTQGTRSEKGDRWCERGFGPPQARFTTSTSDGPRVNERPGATVAGDFDRDGKLDLAVLMEDSGQLWIFAGHGDGSFRHTGSLSVGDQATGLTVLRGGAAGGVLDLLVGNGFGDVLHLEGRGDGTFQIRGKRTLLSVIPDLFGAGQAGVLVGNQQDNRVTVQSSSAAGGGQFETVQTLADDATQLAPGDVQFARLRGAAALPDAIVVSTGSNAVYVYRTTGVRGGVPSFAATPQTFFVLTGDGVPDLVVTNAASGTLTMLPGVGRGFFDDRQPTTLFVLGGAIVQPPTFAAGSGVGIVVTADGHLVRFDLDDVAAGTRVVFTDRGVLAARVLQGGQVVVALSGGSVKVLTEGQGGLSVAAELRTQGGGVPVLPSSLEVIQSGGRLQVLVSSQGSDTIFVFSQVTPVPAPTVPAPPAPPAGGGVLPPVSGGGGLPSVVGGGLPLAVGGGLTPAGGSLPAASLPTPGGSLGSFVPGQVVTASVGGGQVAGSSGISGVVGTSLAPSSGSPTSASATSGSPAGPALAALAPAGEGGSGAAGAGASASASLVAIQGNAYATVAVLDFGGGDESTSTGRRSVLATVYAIGDTSPLTRFVTGQEDAVQQFLAPPPGRPTEEEPPPLDEAWREDLFHRQRPLRPVPAEGPEPQSPSSPGPDEQDETDEAQEDAGAPALDLAVAAFALGAMRAPGRGSKRASSTDTP